MTILPDHIKDKFYKTLMGNVSLHDFEQWLYTNSELEKYLKLDDYLDLISLNFNKNGAKYELYNLLKSHIDIGDFETYKMFYLLREAKLKNDQLPSILMEFYYMYDKGYYFLQDLGLGMGLSVAVPTSSIETIETWEELASEEQKLVLESLSPKLEECIEDVIHWLETKKIVLTGSQNDSSYCYDDFRTEEEKISKIWQTMPKNENVVDATSKNVSSDKSVNKQWWKFWK